jgi:hypothetical protein
MEPTSVEALCNLLGRSRLLPYAWAPTSPPRRLGHPR